MMPSLPCPILGCKPAAPNQNHTEEAELPHFLHFVYEYFLIQGGRISAISFCDPAAGAVVHWAGLHLIRAPTDNSL